MGDDLEPCPWCIDISKWNTRRDKDGKRQQMKVQCEGCGAWWEQRDIQTIRFRKAYQTGEWVRITFTWGNSIYVPMECTQRRCKAQATHKIATKGKRKYKCDRHAGVCIVA